MALASASFRLAEVTSAVAIATDLGAALAPETSLRACLIATELARACDFAEDELADVYYAALLRHIGCTSSAHEETQLVGDELELRGALNPIDVGKPATMLPALAKGLAHGRGPLRKAVAVGSFLARGPAVVPKVFLGRCEVAVRFAVRLGLGPRIVDALDQAYERFDGKGLPRGVRGQAISRVARLLSLAELAVLFLPAGLDTACSVITARAGGQLDPLLARAFVQHARALQAVIAAPSLSQRVLDAEPKPHAMLAASRLPAFAEVLADYVDMKSTFTLGHSRAVAELATNAGKELGLAEGALEELRIAGLVHDLGKVSVSNAIWDKPGKLDAGELERARSHNYETERILSRAEPLAAVARLAALAHERLDGRGYHHGLNGAALGTAARVLAAADVAEALSQPRAHRPPFSPEAAARQLGELAYKGELCPRAVDAVLVASGARRKRARGQYPKGLSEREVEVLRLVARGLTDKEIAQQLGISHRTVHHHNQHAFDKLGVATRSAAALHLIENDLLDA